MPSAMELNALKDRIEEKTIPEPNSGCWIWLGAASGRKNLPDRQKRASLNVFGNRAFLASRASYIAFKGPIPDGMFICHSCDNGLCVNPDHLRSGTHLDNVADMMRKGGLDVRRGEKAHNSVLTEELVIKAKFMHGKGISMYRIAKIFGVNSETIRKALRGETWSHVGYRTAGVAQ